MLALARLTACAAMSMAICGAAGAWVALSSTASWCSRQTARRSAASRCRSAAPTSVSAASSATDCLWPPASRSTHSMSIRRARWGDSSSSSAPYRRVGKGAERRAHHPCSWRERWARCALPTLRTITTSSGRVVARDRLGLEILFKTELAPLAAVAGLLVAAERRGAVVRYALQIDVAGADLATDATGVLERRT